MERGRKQESVSEMSHISELELNSMSVGPRTRSRVIQEIHVVHVVQVILVRLGSSPPCLPHSSSSKAAFVRKRIPEEWIFRATR